MFTYNPARYNSPWHIQLARIASVLLFITGLGILYSDYDFVKSSWTTTGIVSKVDHSSSLSVGQNRYSHPDTYDIDYQFSIDGQHYSGRGSLDCSPGKTVIIYYNRFSPANNKLDLPNTTIARDMTILGALFTLGLFPWRWVFKQSPE